MMMNKTIVEDTKLNIVEFQYSANTGKHIQSL